MSMQTYMISQGGLVWDVYDQVTDFGENSLRVLNYSFNRILLVFTRSSNDLSKIFRDDQELEWFRHFFMGVQIFKDVSYYKNKGIVFEKDEKGVPLWLRTAGRAAVTLHNAGHSVELCRQLIDDDFGGETLSLLNYIGEISFVAIPIINAMDIIANRQKSLSSKHALQQVGYQAIRAGVCYGEAFRQRRILFIRGN